MTAPSRLPVTKTVFTDRYSPTDNFTIISTLNSVDNSNSLSSNSNNASFNIKNDNFNDKNDSYNFKNGITNLNGSFNTKDDNSNLKSSKNKRKRETHRKNLDEAMFIEKIFNHFGNGQTINQTGFESLIRTLQMDQLLWSKLNYSVNNLLPAAKSSVHRAHNNTNITVSKNTVLTI